MDESLKHRFGLGYLVTSLTITLFSIIAMAYYAFNSNWLPAIFVLLARGELTRYLDGQFDRMTGFKR